VARLPVREVAVELHGREAVAVHTRLRLLKTRPRVTATLQGLMIDWARPDGGNGLVVTARLDGGRIEVAAEAGLRARVAQVLGVTVDSPRLTFT
jgi:hypothetical protein